MNMPISTGVLLICVCDDPYMRGQDCTYSLCCSRDVILTMQCCGSSCITHGYGHTKKPACSKEPGSPHLRASVSTLSLARQSTFTIFCNPLTTQVPYSSPHLPALTHSYRSLLPPKSRHTPHDPYTCCALSGPYLLMSKLCCTVLISISVLFRLCFCCRYVSMLLWSSLSGILVFYVMLVVLIEDR